MDNTAIAFAHSFSPLLGCYDPSSVLLVHSLDSPVNAAWTLFVVRNNNNRITEACSMQGREGGEAGCKFLLSSALTLD